MQSHPHNYSHIYFNSYLFSSKNLLEEIERYWEKKNNNESQSMLGRILNLKRELAEFEKQESTKTNKEKADFFLRLSNELNGLIQRDDEDFSEIKKVADQHLLMFRYLNFRNKIFPKASTIKAKTKFSVIAFAKDVLLGIVTGFRAGISAVDDIVNAMKNFIPALAAAIAVPIATTVAHFLGGVESGADMKETFEVDHERHEEKKQLNQLKQKDVELGNLANYESIKQHPVNMAYTSIAANSVGIAASVIGIGLSGAYLASALGASLGIFSLFTPFLLPATFGLLFVRALSNASLAGALFRKAKKDEAQAKIERDTAWQELNAELKRSKNVSIQDGDKLQAVTNLQDAIKRFEISENHYQACKKARENAKKKFVFSIIETVLTALVVVGSVLGTAAIVGAATVATAGIAPTVLGCGAAVATILVKGFQKADEKWNWTGKLKNKWNQWFPPKAKEEHVFLPSGQPNELPTSESEDISREEIYFEDQAIEKDVENKPTNDTGAIITGLNNGGPQEIATPPDNNNVIDNPEVVAGQVNREIGPEKTITRRHSVSTMGTFAEKNNTHRPRSHSLSSAKLPLDTSVTRVVINQ